ncbi:MAG: serine/threonine-protein kinase [Polyangia bacterium]
MTAERVRKCPECGRTYPIKVLYCRTDGCQLGDPGEELASAVKPTPGRDQLLGRTVARRFVLTEYIGSGATGLVYRAVHKALDREMAVKLLKRELLWDERSLLRFFREAKTCSAVDHPNIVYLYDFGHDDTTGLPYLVMEFVSGQTLHQAIHGSPTGNLPVERALAILLQVCHAIEHAHNRGVIHRDIKPENILLTERDGRADWVKVLDFGVARMVGEPPVTGHGQISGTAEFIAPELLIGDGSVTPAGDLYALGILFHDAIVGRPPFSGRLEIVLQQHMTATPPRLLQRYNDPMIPPALDDLVARLLLKEPAKRPSAAETSRELEQILSNLYDSARSPQTLHDQATQELPLLHRATQVVGAVERKTMVVERPDRPTQVLGRDNWPTQLLPQVVTEAKAEAQAVADADAYARLAKELFAQAVELADRICTGSWPSALKNLGSKVADCYKQEVELAEKLFSLEKLLADKAAASGQHNALRQQILALSEQLQADAAVNEDDRKRLTAELEQKERAFFDAEARWRRLPPTSPDSLRRRIADVRRERVRAQILFVRLIVEMPTAGALLAQRDQLAARLFDIDNPKRSGPQGAVTK